jgi:hypothetical protein
MIKLLIIILTSIVFISCGQGKDNNSSELKSIGLTEIDSVKNEKSIQETDIVSPETKMLNYLSAHFERIQDSTFLKKPDWMIGTNKADTICGYIISFKEGHSFKHQQECVEWGEIVTVKFKGYKSDEVRKIVEDLFRKENYDWYSNNTEYRPKEYYETVWTFRIKEEKDLIKLDFSYSWI